MFLFFRGVLFRSPVFFFFFFSEEKSTPHYDV